MQKISILLFLFFTFTVLPIGNAAQARIDIVPRKLVIENRERSGEINILNLSNEESTFRMSLVSFRQNENGLYEELEKPLDPAFDPDRIVRFSPRQFTLKPGGRQKVRLSLRKPANLPEGEYRFHVKAMRLANINNNQLEDGVYMHANVGVTIPVVVRHGQTEAQARLSNITLVSPAKTERNRPELHLTINREGTQSAIGKLDIFWRANGQEEKKIGTMGNTNVFTDINKRFVKVPLSEMPYGAGTITVRYAKEQEEGAFYDEVTLQR